MGDQEVKLLGVWASVFSKRVEIALKMKGISYENVAQDLSNKSPELLKYNPIHKKVPVLLHNGKPICESLVILEYIDETWKSGPSILPKDPYDRATARFWAKFIDDKIHPAIWKIRGSQGEEREKTIEEATEHLKTLENELKDKKFFGGDEIGLVDITGFWILQTSSTYRIWLRWIRSLLRVRKAKQIKEPTFVIMGDQEVKFLGVWASPFSKRVEIALKMKGISYEYVAQDLSNKSPELLKYNPIHKKVPVLLHNGKPICESLVILEYIDDTWKSGPSILPKDPYDRATARFWAKFIDDKIHPAILKIRGSRGEEQEKAIEEATEHLKTLENELKDKKFFGGDEIGLVDITGNFVALWIGVFLELVGIKLLTKEKFSRLSEWIDDFLSNSTVKEILPAREDLLAFFRSLLEQST